MADKTSNTFDKILASKGLRVTNARKMNFDALFGHEPLTMSQLIAKLKGKVDRVSVYRNVELFEKLGIVNKLYFGWKYKIELSDIFIGHHHHLICIDCGEVKDIKGEAEIDRYISQVTKKAGFAPTRHTFDVEGYCNKCNSNA
jgi:Fe2+ or Zn2+ uptake regulation protein